MIVKNEEDVLARCLNSIKNLVDEIIIIDTGSTDQTKEIAKEFTSNLFDFEWIQDFSAARNYAFSKASKDFILWLDADDVLLEEHHQSFLAMKEELNPEIDTVMLKYNVGFDDEGNVTFSFYRERLVRRVNNFKWIEPVHEYIQTSGNTIIRDIPITHKKIKASSDRNLAIYEAMQRKGQHFSTRGLYYYAKELMDHKKYKKAIQSYHKFLGRSDGWIEDKINACFSLSICYQHTKQNNKILQILFQTFEYDLPRAEICCSIGYYYIELQQYKSAIFWYDLATKLEKPEENRGFISHDYWGFIPNIQLCICYDRLGNLEEAMKYNEIAAEYKPNSPAVIHNRNYFSTVTHLGG
jgi:glycosyltransferase involved in cell wall biosynthesis